MAIDGVPATLLIPLAGRVYTSQNFPDFFHDEKALELAEVLPLAEVTALSSQYAMLANATRQYNLDAMSQEFLNTHSRCNVVHLGAGLNASSHRLTTRDATFYEIDLPEVAQLRRQLLPESDRETIIAADIFEPSWLDELDTKLPTLLIAAGVFQYFRPEKVHDFIRLLKQSFPAGELLFDATNQAGIQYANMYVRRTGNKSAPMHFFINNADEFAASCATTLVERRLFYSDARAILKGRTKLYTRVAMALADWRAAAFIMHLRLN